MPSDLLLRVRLGARQDGVPAVAGQRHAVCGSLDQNHRLAKQGLPLREGLKPIKKHNLLRSFLVCPAFHENKVLAGTYIPEAKEWGSNEKRLLLRNGEDRYHFLPPEEPIQPDPIVLDFKLVLGVNTDYLEELVATKPDVVIAVLNPPYRDRLTQRFAGYFTRIAEPEE